MQQSRRRIRNKAQTLYNEDTDPGLPRITLPLPAYQHANMREPWHRRLAHGLHQGIVFIIRKIILLLNFALVLLLLILLTRFLLSAFALHASLFADWIFQVSSFLILPFNNLLPMFIYHNLLIETNTLVAMVTYTIILKLFTGFLHSLIGSKKKQRDQAWQSW